MCYFVLVIFFFFKQKTAYEMRISDWSSDVCSSDLRSWRAAHPAGPRVMAETSGKNAVVITPSADFDLAVGDVVRSAFGHAGQKCSAASLVILVGPAGRSPRPLRQLVDAVRSVRTGWPSSPGATMGPPLDPPTAHPPRPTTHQAPRTRWPS